MVLELLVVLVLVSEVRGRIIVYDGPSPVLNDTIGEDYTAISPWLFSKLAWDKKDGISIVPYYFTSDIDLATTMEAKRIMMVFEEKACVRFEEVYEPSDKLLKIGLKPKDSQGSPCDSSISGSVKTDDSDWQKSTLEMNRNFCDMPRLDSHSRTRNLPKSGFQITEGRDCWIKGTVLIENKVERCTKNIMDAIEKEFVEGMLCRCVLQENHDEKMEIFYTDGDATDESWSGTFMHEMFHVFGVYHTQERPDRDDYIKILEENIEEDELDQYERCDECEVMPGSKYECNSIMHYSVYTLAKDKDEAKSGARPTMESRNEELCPTEQLKGSHRVPTANDWMTLRHALKC